MGGLRIAKQIVRDKLKINDLNLLLSSMDGPLLRYMHVFRIMQNVQERFVSGIFSGRSKGGGGGLTPRGLFLLVSL